MEMKSCSHLWDSSLHNVKPLRKRSSFNVFLLLDGCSFQCESKDLFVKPRGNYAGNRNVRPDILNIRNCVKLSGRRHDKNPLCWARKTEQLTVNCLLWMGKSTVLHNRVHETTTNRHERLQNDSFNSCSTYLLMWSFSRFQSSFPNHGVPHPGKM